MRLRVRHPSGKQEAKLPRVDATRVWKRESCSRGLCAAGLFPLGTCLAIEERCLFRDFHGHLYHRSHNRETFLPVHFGPVIGQKRAIVFRGKGLNDLHHFGDTFFFLNCIGYLSALGGVDYAR